MLHVCVYLFLFLFLCLVPGSCREAWRDSTSARPAGRRLSMNVVISLDARGKGILERRFEQI